MRRLGWFLRLFYQFYLILILAVPLLLLYPFYRILLGSKDFGRVYRANRFMARYFSILGLIPVKVKWNAPLPNAPFVVCANHASYLDILYLVLPFRERFIYLGKGEIQRWPYFRMFFNGMNIPMGRGKQRQAKEALIAAGKELKEGRSVAIYPEGTIPSEAPQLGAFKKGAFRLAEEEQVPIVPVTFLDHWRLFPEGEGFWGSIRAGVSRIVVHEPVYPDGKDHQELMAITRKRIEEGWGNEN
jgi:1-acyl-sn-glycerol-3-phosphate acyltransferase